jgi:uncharacterized protein YkwD
VNGLLGKPGRVDASDYDFDWHIFNSDYNRFIMVGIKNGLVEALYTNSRGFESYYGNYGGTNPGGDSNTFMFTDDYNKDRIYGCLIISGDVLAVSYSEEFFAGQELQILDATNAFRANYGINPLDYCDVAARTSRGHSRDMADRKFFDHETPEGSTVFDRYRKQGGRNIGIGENIAMGFLTGVEALDGWINSEDHRKNLLLRQYSRLGAGVGYDQSNNMLYFTQTFVV